MARLPLRKRSQSNYPRQLDLAIEDTMDDGASVGTSNISVDLQPDVVDAYIDIFAHHIYVSTCIQPLNHISSRAMLEALPDLLRDFALQLAAGERCSDATVVGIFTRQHKQYVQSCLCCDVLLKRVYHTAKLERF